MYSSKQQETAMLIDRVNREVKQDRFSALTNETALHPVVEIAQLYYSTLIAVVLTGRRVNRSCLLRNLIVMLANRVGIASRFNLRRFRIA